MTEFEIARDIVLLTLGATGTILSVYNFYDIRRKNTRNLKLSLSTSTPLYPSGVGEPLLEVVVTNTGLRNVTVTNFGIELPDGRVLAMMRSPPPGFDDTQTPKTLSDGEIAKRYFPYGDISDAIRSLGMARLKIKPFAVDSAGRRHYGAVQKFKADRW